MSLKLSLGIAAMRLLAHLPLSWLRMLGWVLGKLLYVVAGSRRHVVLTNLKLCFPELADDARHTLAKQVFVYFAQALLDRSWLWHGAEAVIRQRVQLVGAMDELQGDAPTILFAPHFVGLDAGATALSSQVPREFHSIVMPQRTQALNDYVKTGRTRFGNAKAFDRFTNLKQIVASLRAGEPLYLLPDMNFGPHESIFVPFYGVPAATLPSLHRFARLGRAKVVPVVTRMTAKGYEVELLPHWSDFPTDNIEADTALMNQRLESYINSMPAQYYWVHKRFKSRPPGESKVY